MTPKAMPFLDVKQIVIAAFLVTTTGIAAGTASVPAITMVGDACRGLIGRVIPQHAGQFIIETIPAEMGRDVFEIESRAGKIVLRGNNGVAIASALNYYLKTFCHCDLSWCGDQLELPSLRPGSVQASLPVVPQKVRVVNAHQWRVYFNYCTLSYTGAWWDWERWQREIDFMALNGINMPLAPTGLEAVWYNTLLKFKFTDSEARAFLVGPAFFAWQWMQNIEGHCGPLPKSWIDSHTELARKILARERELGMTPIQQGFSGHVPRLMKQKFPEAAMKQQLGWCGFPGVMQLDPLDPLFARFGKAFIEEEIKLYGTSHVYAADPFHESSPPKQGGEYLQQVGVAIEKLLTGVDPEALWAMQAWSIRKDIATAVPKDRLLVLDLSGDKWRHPDYKNFWDHDFVVGQLHNFGGRINLHGDLAEVANNKFMTAKRQTANAVGMGLFPEGTTQNPVFYNLVFDMVWREGPVDLKNWLRQYAWRRYGVESVAAGEGWGLLLKTVYRKGSSGVESSSIIAARPALNVKKSGPNAGFAKPDPSQQLVRAWECLLEDRERLKASDGYRFDVIDVARQVLSNLGQSLQKEVTRAHVAKDKAAFENASRQFLELLGDVDTICATRNEYNFGKWIGDARRWGTTEAEKALYEYNASMLVTLWGPEEDQKHKPGIFDYSWREWAGLIGTYYRPRWEMFFRYLREHPDYHEEGLPRAYGRESLRANEFYSQLADWETAWTKQHHDLPSEPVGDPVEISVRMLEKYRPLLDRYFPPQDLGKPSQQTNATLSLLTAALPADREQFHVFLLMGQSNMAGAAPLEPGDERPVPGVYALPTLPAKDFAWQPATHPLHNRQPKSNHFGLGLSFAVEYQKQHPGVSVGLIPLAVGGAPISVLNKGTPVYTDALRKVTFASTQGILKGVLWHQGESDTVKVPLADGYAAALDKLVTDLRHDLKLPNLPFIAGNLAEFYGTSREHNAPDRVTRIHQICLALRTLPQRLPHTALVESTGLKSMDAHNVHFDRASYIELGRRYAVALQALDVTRTNQP